MGNDLNDFQDLESRIYQDRGAVFYEIKQGDTLLGIAKKIKVARQLESFKREDELVKLICQDNKITKPNSIKVRDKINIAGSFKTIRSLLVKSIIFLETTRQLKELFSIFLYG